MDGRKPCRKTGRSREGLAMGGDLRAPPLLGQSPADRSRVGPTLLLGRGLGGKRRQKTFASLMSPRGAARVGKSCAVGQDPSRDVAPSERKNIGCEGGGGEGP